MNRIDLFHTEHPEYGSRRLARHFGISRDKAHRLMQVMHIAATYPKRHTSLPNHEHAVFPYLLRNVSIVRPNQAWSTDITYIGLSRGFTYLTAIIDWYSRFVLSWRLSNTMDAMFCVEALEEAFDNFGEPEIFNSDQGSQFTSRKFLRCFDDKQTRNSMDGKGRWIDNVYIERLWWTVKHEDVYLRRYETVTELSQGLARFFHWYNTGRIHSSLNYKTPWSVYCDET
jgi:Transposase and inactivated derivatives